ncbi:MAG: CHAT domain-containing protein [Thermoanaerobaculia bacterium]
MRRVWILLIGLALAVGIVFLGVETARDGPHQTDAVDPESLDRRALELEEEGDLDGARQLTREALAGREAASPDSPAVAANLSRLGRLSSKLSELTEAIELCGRGLALQQRYEADGLDAAASHNCLGAVAALRDQREESELHFDAALKIAFEKAPESLLLADTLTGLGRLARVRGERDRAEDLHRQALELRSKIRPESLQVAASLTDLGVIEIGRGKLAEAERLFARAVALQEDLGFRGLERAETTARLGLVKMRQGEYEEAEALFGESLQLARSRGAETLEEALALNLLGRLAWVRNDLVTAEELQRRSLAIDEALIPGSSRFAADLNNLAIVLTHREDLALAETLLRRALRVMETLAPESRLAATILNNLGDLALQRNDWDTAEPLFERSLALKQKVAPGSLTVAIALENLASVAQGRGELEKAEKLHRDALGIREAKATGGYQSANSFYLLGEVVLARGRVAEAVSLHGRALEIRERSLPGSAFEADSLQALARIAQAGGDRKEALGLFYRSIEALEKQTERLGGRQEIRAEFGTKYLPFYQRLIDLLVESGRERDAFDMLERSRARTLLALLAERELDLSIQIPPDLDRARTRIEAEYDRLQGRLGRLSRETEGEQLAGLLTRQRELRDEFDRLKRQLRAESPRAAALRHPQPADLDGARKALDPGTLLLSYVVAEQHGWLFVVHPATAPGPGLAVHRLPVGREALARRVEIFLALIERRGAGEEAETALLEQGRRLFEQVLEPATDAIAGADRLLISPDGPLHVLPFSALVLPAFGEAVERPHRFLVESKPIHRILSATLYAELRAARREGAGAGSSRVAVFADAVSPSTVAGGDPGRGSALGPLPESREEAHSVSAIFGRQARIYTGRKATEARVRSVAADVDILHFAVHSLLDERSPLNSSLVLSATGAPAAGQDNGLLQAWEVFETVRLDADLVTLSACQTALGADLGGEGLMGLARAFQFAGARSLLATLWTVSDRSTAELMRRFYTGLAAGDTKDAALRAAQLDFIRGDAGPTSTGPFHWAGFELIGDWR